MAYGSTRKVRICEKMDNWAGEDLKVCWFDLTFTNIIEPMMMHICDMACGAIIKSYYQVLNS